MKYPVFVSDDQVTEIIKKELLDARSDLMSQVDGCGRIFDLDAAKDSEKVKEHIRAFEMVLTYMCGSNWEHNYD